MLKDPTGIQFRLKETLQDNQVPSTNKRQGQRGREGGWGGDYRLKGT